MIYSRQVQTVMFFIYLGKSFISYGKIRHMEPKQSGNILSRVVIRDYKQGDYEAIIALWAETGLGGAHRGDNRDVIEESLRIGGKLLVAELDDGRLVGTSWMTYDGRRLHLHHLGVAPECQRRGLGRHLTVVSLAFARERNIQTKLEVHQSNHAAIALYRSLGFQYLGDYDVYIIRTFV